MPAPAPELAGDVFLINGIPIALDECNSPLPVVLVGPVFGGGECVHPRLQVGPRG